MKLHQVLLNTVMLSGRPGKAGHAYTGGIGDGEPAGSRRHFLTEAEKGRRIRVLSMPSAYRLSSDHRPRAVRFISTLE